MRCVSGGIRRGMCCGEPFGGIISANLSDRMIASSISAADTARFINSVVARKRIGLNSWPDIANYLQEGVQPIIGSAVEVGELVKEPVDFAFASNLFEHLTQADLMTLLAGVRKILSPRGTLNIIQPNYRYAYREYFDDYTHIAVYSDVSLCDVLRVSGFEILDVKPRFLPLTIKSRLPVRESLIRAYLASPIKPMGKQMLIRARVRSVTA